jgi:hypothetical protein
MRIILTYFCKKWGYGPGNWNMVIILRERCGIEAEHLLVRGFININQ